MSRALLTALAVLTLINPGTLGFQAEPQLLREQINTPEFAKTLNRMLSLVNPGAVPSLDPKTGLQTGPLMPAAFVGITPSQKLVLPGAAICNISEVFYACDWETKPNKFSVAMIQEYIASGVAAALPPTWTREQGDSTGLRYTEFTDPAGQIMITVSCPVSIGNFPLSSYVAKLTIHRTEPQFR